MTVPVTRTKYSAFITLQDHEGRLSIPKYNITQAAYEAYLTDTSAGVVSELFNALNPLTVDNIVNRGVTKEGFSPSPSAPPVSESAINTASLIVTARDSVTGQVTRSTIPARDVSNYTSVRGVVNLLDASHVEAFVTAYEVAVRSEDGNALTVLSIKVVGR